VSVILEVRNLSKYFPVEGSHNPIHAVKSVNLTQQKGEAIGIVGESGCGKSTLARLILRLLPATGGEVFFEGENLMTLSAGQLRNKRRQMQMIFQDPFASLDPRQKVATILAEPFVIHRLGTRSEREKHVAELLQRVGLPNEAGGRYPHEFSGGQRQRINIARAIALNPRFIIADEPVSALDVSIQSQILNLLNKLKQDLALSYLFISHDLAVVKHISNKVAVMYLGEIIELASTDDLFHNPSHPYTQALISAIPQPKTDRKRKRIILEGDVPDHEQIPGGCMFHPRCPLAMPKCSRDKPRAINIGAVDNPHHVSCFLVG
jgi:oligopeptide/dipeptide ABC transporter ATP-binding protein